MNIRTIKLKSIDDQEIMLRVAKFSRGSNGHKHNYVTVNQATGLPVARHVQWDKARDRVLKEHPAMKLTIVDCTGTENVHSRAHVERANDVTEIQDDQAEGNV